MDNTSPFTSDILACLDHLDEAYVYKTFSEVTDAHVNQCDNVILSGRRKHSKEINLINSRIIRYCSYYGKSLLGICYGAEIIALTLGGSICKMPGYVHGLAVVSVSTPNHLIGENKSITVYESHGYSIAKLPPNFKSLARSKYCDHEIFANNSNMYGVQFHPEKSGSDGLALFKNFSRL